MAAGSRASAFSRPGPAWYDEEAADSSRIELVSWNAAKIAPSPAAAFAMSAICVEVSSGMPTLSRTASPVRSSVMAPTMPTVRTSVPRPNLRLPSSSSWPSCAIDVERRLDPRRQRHRHREREQDRDDGGDSGAPVI